MSASPYPSPSRHGAIPAGRLRNIHGLGIAAQSAAGVVVAAGAVTSYTDVHLAGAVRDYSYGDGLAALNDADVLNRLASLANLLLFLISGVLFIVWLWRARANTEFFCDAPHRHRRGWVIGGWFVPIVGFWFPVQVVDDVVRASSQYVWPRDGSLQAAPQAAVVRRLWGTYLGMNLTSVLATTQQSSGLAASTRSASQSALDAGAALSIVSTRPQVPWWQTPTPPAW